MVRSTDGPRNMWQITPLVVNLVARHRGTLPVLITCPHGGDAVPADVPERTGQTTPAGCDFEKNRDLHTKEIALGVAQRMLDIFGEAPYVVVADFHRKYIDANRSRTCAFESAAAQPFYDEYHQTLRSFVDEIRAETGGLGLLFDIHGTSGIAGDPPDIVYLGTADGQTVARLRAADPHALWRRRSLRGFLEAAGHVVSPTQPGVPEVPRSAAASRCATTAARMPMGWKRFSSRSRALLRTDADRRNALDRRAGVCIRHARRSLRRWAHDERGAEHRPARCGAHRGGRRALQRRAESNDAGLRLGGLARAARQSGNPPRPRCAAARRRAGDVRRARHGIIFCGSIRRENCAFHPAIRVTRIWRERSWVGRHESRITLPHAGVAPGAVPLRHAAPAWRGCRARARSGKTRFQRAHSPTRKRATKNSSTTRTATHTVASHRPRSRWRTTALHRSAESAPSALSQDQRAWVLALDRSAIERMPDAAMRQRLLEEIDWREVEFPGNVPKGSQRDRHDPAPLAPGRRAVQRDGDRRARAPCAGVRSPITTLRSSSVPGQPKPPSLCRSARRFRAHARAASADGVELVITSSWRSRKKQGRHRAASSRIPKPRRRGKSAHMYGLAIDLRMSVPGLPVAEANTRTAEKMANLVRMYRSPVYKWMALRGREFGWYPVSP